ncbi:hypothetical protein PFISCL1PPCAC_5408 [Pristionchus fissidentatus]|uniref:Uncharacterized protein n=1 Tax=Pristionchus fissidentatus TaxID=1538716 RepID=A0AAV5V3Z5_9BILA|nr:hypothetical protein PFISCL1PPCAC_5408 [Pristionchus fissidentatus]
MGEVLEVYIDTAEKRNESGKVYAFGCLFPARRELNYCRRMRYTSNDETTFAQLCALAHILVKADHLNKTKEKEGNDGKNRAVERIIVRTNARRFVSSIQMELSKFYSDGYLDQSTRKTHVIEIVLSYRQIIPVDLYFASTSDAHVGEVATLAASALNA